jgi:hypothetical protein
MSLLKFKTGVRVSRQAIIAAAVVNAANVLGLSVDMVCTSGNDSKHMADSKHYRDEALDFRTHHLAGVEKANFAREVRRRLGTDYDVMLEGLGTSNEHLHCEYDPK